MWTKLVATTPAVAMEKTMVKENDGDDDNTDGDNDHGDGGNAMKGLLEFTIEIVVFLNLSHLERLHDYMTTKADIKGVVSKYLRCHY
ncbi:unnamed protein product [Ilex paraguariensis]|uniref:Uncharacterized protein n=1 Tax=Ilex paraguariensis TaxID=185542 RepID=A0ABC8T2F4_9AQUA